MVMSKLLHKVVLLFMVMTVWTTNGVSAQVLPLINSFRGNTFNGTIDVSWPVEFDGCTFITDSIVIRCSYGALFRNCRFVSRTGILYIAERGDGMILADCEATGCQELRFCRMSSLSDRNYIAGVTLNGEECSVLDDQETIIDIDGLELEESVRGVSDGPLIMIMNADKSVLKSGETSILTVRGLKDGMFVGWQSSDPTVNLMVDGEFSCKVIMPAQITDKRIVVISAYSEYGLEAACMLTLVPDEAAASGKKAHKKKK